MNPVNLREATFADYDQIIKLESTQNLRVRNREEWSRMWLENPLYKELEGTWPIGWVLEDSGRPHRRHLRQSPAALCLPGTLAGRRHGTRLGCRRALPRHGLDTSRHLFQPAQRRPLSQYDRQRSRRRRLQCLRFNSCVPAGDWTAASYWVDPSSGVRQHLPLPR